MAFVEIEDGSRSVQERRYMSLCEEAERSYMEDETRRKAFLSATHSDMAVLTCIDGRARTWWHLGFRLGTVVTKRRAGLRFSLGGAAFRKWMEQWVDKDPDRPNIIFHVLHHSSAKTGDSCGYWGDKGGVPAALKHSARLKKKLEAAYPGQLYVVIMLHDTEDNSYTVLDPSWLQESSTSRDPHGRWVAIYLLPSTLGSGNMLAAVRQLFNGWPDEVTSDIAFVLKRSLESDRTTHGPHEREKHEDTIVLGVQAEHLCSEHTIFAIDELGGNSSKQVEMAVMMVAKNVLAGNACTREGDRILLVAQVKRERDYKNPVRDSQLKVRAEVAAIDLVEKLDDICRGRRERDSPFTPEERTLINVFLGLPRQLMAVTIDDEYRVDVLKNWNLEPQPAGLDQPATVDRDKDQSAVAK